MQVLDRIQRSIPKELLDKVTRKEQVAPKLANMIRAMSEGKTIPDVDMSQITDKDKDWAKVVIDSGYIKELEKEVDVEDKEVARKIDKFLDEEIYKATMRGELPKGKKFRNLKKQINGTSKRKS